MFYPYFLQVLAKYADWADEHVGSAKALLSNLMGSKASAAADTLRGLTTSTSVVEIDAAIDANIESAMPAVKEAAEDLKKHRQKLQEDTVAALKEAVKLEDPLTILSQIDVGKPFGDGTQRELQALDDRLKDLYKKANEDMKELVSVCIQSCLVCSTSTKCP
eukprot:SAG11_NODE_301_length_11038_cov_2.312826_4_plen_162_part_00